PAGRGVVAVEAEGADVGGQPGAHDRQRGVDDGVLVGGRQAPLAQEGGQGGQPPGAAVVIGVLEVAEVDAGPVEVDEQDLFGPGRLPFQAGASDDHVHLVPAGAGVGGRAGLQIVGAGRADDVVDLRAQRVVDVGGERRRVRQSVKADEVAVVVTDQQIAAGI